MWYTRIKYFYESAHPSYTNERLKTFVKAGMITADQYYEITKVQYVE